MLSTKNEFVIKFHQWKSIIASFSILEVHFQIPTECQKTSFYDKKNTENIHHYVLTGGFNLICTYKWLQVYFTAEKFCI